METPKIFESEYRLLKIIWAQEPLKSMELVRLAAEELGWKRTTTFTVVKRLSDRGVLVNENTVIRTLVSQEEAESAEVTELLESRFGGSVPAFIAAFSRSKGLSEKDLKEIMDIIDKA